MGDDANSVRSSSSPGATTVAAILIYHLGNLIARVRKSGADDPKPLEAVGPLGGDPA